MNNENNNNKNKTVMDNNGLKIGLGVGGGAIIIGLFAYLVIKKNKIKKH